MHFRCNLTKYRQNLRITVVKRRFCLLCLSLTKKIQPPARTSRLPSATNPAKRIGAESEEIPTIAQFSAKPETERWWEFLSWYARGDLNPYPSPEWNLNPSCLPISPRARIKIGSDYTTLRRPPSSPSFHPCTFS